MGGIWISTPISVSDFATVSQETGPRPIWSNDTVCVLFQGDFACLITVVPCQALANLSASGYFRQELSGLSVRGTLIRQLSIVTGAEGQDGFFSDGVRHPPSRYDGYHSLSGQSDEATGTGYKRPLPLRSLRGRLF